MPYYALHFVNIYSENCPNPNLYHLIAKIDEKQKAGRRIDK